MYKERVVGHVRLAISKCISLFLTLAGSFLENKVIEKRINRGREYGLEVPCKYRISRQQKAVDWIKRKVTTLLQEHSLAVNKYLGKKYKRNFLCVRVMEDDYGSNIHAGLEKSASFMECLL